MRLTAKRALLVLAVMALGALAFDIIVIVNAVSMLRKALGP